MAPASYTNDAAGNLGPVTEWHFAITDKWVRTYMSYPTDNHASIWLAACRGGSAAATPLRDAFRAVGAEMVSGWTSNVKGEAVLAATSFLFDRLLGANKVVPPATPQRAFDYENCWTELRSRGLHRHPATDEDGNATTTDIIYEGTSGDDTFGTFAPSIAYVLVSEITDRIHLVGLFGNPPAGEQQVLVGGIPAHIESWEPRKIVASIPRSGDGAAGDVQVLVRGHRSNVRRISRWTLTGTYKMTEDGSPHVIDGSLTIVFRADIGEYRLVPGNVFVRPTRYAVASQDSEVYLEAKGIVVSDCGLGKSESETWHGSGLFPTYDPTGPYISVVYLSVDTITHDGGLAFAIGLRDLNAFPLKDTIVTCEGQTYEFPIAPAPPGSPEDPQYFGSPLDERLPDGSAVTFPLPGGPVTFGDDWAIPAGTMSSTLEATWKWNSAAAEFAPDPQMAR